MNPIPPVFPGGTATFPIAKNTAATLTIAAINSVAVSVNVLDGTEFIPGNVAVFNDGSQERVRISAVNSNTLTIQRGYWGTIPNSHASGTIIEVLIDDNYYNTLASELESIENWLPSHIGSITGFVPLNRQVIAGSGMTGGGDLSADRTFNANVTSVFGRTGAIVMTPADVSGVGGVMSSRQILTGYGLAGGGNLSADRTLVVVDDTSNQKLRLSNSATLVGTRREINFIQGANVVLTMVDDSANNRVNITLAATAAGGGMADPTTTKGDIVARGAASPATRLGVGTDGQVLTADSAQALGLKWTTPSSGGASAQTPWLADIDAASHKLTNVLNLAIGSATVTYPLNVTGDCNITGVYRVNGTPITTGGGGSQTPWISDINAMGYKLTNVGAIGAGSSSTPRCLISVIPLTTATVVGNAVQILAGEATNTPGYGATLGYYIDTGSIYKSVLQSLSGGGGAALLLNPSGGTVGIAMTAPTSVFHIYSGGNINPSVTYHSLNLVSFDQGNVELVFGTNSVSPFAGYIQARGYTNSAWQLLINPLGGGVGIGNSNPRAALVVCPSVNPGSSAGSINQLLIGEATNDANYHLAIGYYSPDGTNWRGVIQNVSAGAVAPLLLNPLGANVGIGVVSPGVALDVAGGINASASVQTQTKFYGPNTMTSQPACLQIVENAGGVSANQPVQSISFDANTTTNQLLIFVKYSTGTSKSVVLNLT